MAFLEGAFKYGRHNYRPAGVRGSIYFDAAIDHLSKWWEGEDWDRDTEVDVGKGPAALHHVTKAICCLIVLRDSMLTGNWVDDRPPVTLGPEHIDYLQEIADGLRSKYPEPKAPFTESGVYCTT